LKNLVIYNIFGSDGGTVKVAVLNNNLNSLTYRNRKTSQTTLLINNNGSDEKIIRIKSIISENDSIIVARK